jgi:hypothetical protein
MRLYMITDDYVDKLYDEIYKKDVEIARLNAEVARLLELMEMSGRLMKLMETRARPDAKTEPKTDGETTCLT